MTEAEELELLELEAQAAGAGQSSDGALNITEEQSPLVSTAERLKLMALGTPKGRYSTLRKNLADKGEVVLADGDVPATNPSGRLLMRAKGEDAFRPLDPKGWQGFGELGKDIVEGLPEIALGTGGDAAFKTPVGKLGGMAEGGLVAAGLEGGRQLLGSASGIEDNIDPSLMAESGLGGAGGALLFGTGASKGILSDGLDKLYQRAAGAFHGVSPRAIAALKKYAPELRGFEEKGSSGKANALQEIAATAKMQVKNVKDEVGRGIGDVARDVDAKGGVLEAASILAPFEEEKARLLAESALDAKGDHVPATLDAVREIDDVMDNLFGKERREQLSALAGLSVRDGLKDPAGVLRRKSREAATESLLKKAAERSRRNIADQIDAQADNQFIPLLNRYEKAANAGSLVDDAFRNTKKDGSEGLSDKATRELQYLKMKEYDRELGTDIAGQADFLEAFDKFGKMEAPFAKRPIRSYGIPLAGAVVGTLGSWASTDTDDGEEFSPWWSLAGGAALGGLAGTRSGVRFVSDQGERLIKPWASRALRSGTQGIIQSRRGEGQSNE